MICERTGKECHEDAGEARARIRHLKERNPRAANGLLAYACKFCGGWHIGHPKNSPKERAVNSLRRHRITHLRRPGAEA